MTFVKKRIAVLSSRELSPEVALFLSRPEVELAEPRNAEGLIAVALPADAAPTLREFKDAEKPIALLDAAAISLAAKCFQNLGLTLAQIPGAPAGVFWEACASDDYVSDREHRILSTLGLTSMACAKALAELIQLA